MSKFKNTLVYLDFEVFSVSQLEKLEEIKKQSNKITVCVKDVNNTDREIVPTVQKVEIISSLRCVDSCFSSENEDNIDKTDFDNIVKIN